MSGPGERLGGEAPVLSVLIVTWNCRDMAGRCLRALFASTLEVPFEVIVIDNASGDGTAGALARAFPAVRVIANGDNVGFAKANNQGIRLARGELLMLLNPDAFPATPETFGRMVRFLGEHPEYAGAGCRLVHEDGRHQVGDAGFEVSPGHLLAYAIGLSQWWPGRAGVFLGKVSPRRPWLDVDWICGAFLLLRRRVVETAGGLDENYFLYGEDVEWGCRLRRHGHRLAYVPEQTVIHLQGGTQDLGAIPSTRWLDGLAQVYRQLNPGRHRLWFTLPMAAGLALRAGAYRAAAVLLCRPGHRRKSRALWHYARHAWTAPWPASD